MSERNSKICNRLPNLDQVAASQIVFVKLQENESCGWPANQGWHTKTHADSAIADLPPTMNLVAPVATPPGRPVSAVYAYLVAKALSQPPGAVLATVRGELQKETKINSRVRV